MPIYKIAGEKKDGLQKYRVKVNYTDVNGKYKQIERIAYGAEQARIVERSLEDQTAAQDPRRAGLTLNALFEEYKKTKKYEIRETTLKKTEAICENHILPYLGDYRLDRLNVSILQNWKNKIEEKNLSLSSRHNIYAALRGVLNYAVLLEYLPRNPLLKIGNFKDPYAAENRVDFYTPEEFLKFIEAARRDAEANEKDIFTWNYYVFFNIAFFTGLRKGEIHALKWSDIDGNVLHVRRSINQKLSGGDRETPPKNKSSVRSLQIPLPLQLVLNEHFERYKKNVADFNNDFRICGGFSPLRDTSVENKNIAYAKAAGVKHIRIHDFRHSHASVLANEGINIQEIARRLGHSKIERTWNTYAHLYPREEERAVNVLNTIFERLPTN